MGSRTNQPLRRAAPLGSAALTALLFGSGCADPSQYDVVLYCAHDQIHAEPLVREFERETGLSVDARFDVELDKTVGLVAALREEAKTRPRCDVFWNNEVANTIALANEGLLASYDSPSAADIPEKFRDSEHRWTGFGARARILIVNTELVPDWESEVTGMDDLVDPKWAERGLRTGMALPLTGTTLTHFAALMEVLGEEETRAHIAAIKAADVELMKGNAHVMRQVCEGNIAFGWTDTDDFNVGLEGGAPVVAVYPDQGGIGTMVIPNTVAILKDAPHPDAAETLVDWILSKELEAKLAASRSAQIPVRPDVPRPDHVRSTADFDVMDVDFAAVGERISARLEEFTELFNE